MTQRLSPTQTAEELRAVLVDDHTLFRQGLRQSLQADGIDVIGEASNGAAGAKLVAELRPEVVVMDLHMPVMGGIDATRAILNRDPGARVLILTITDDEEEVVEALTAGACGYVLKDSPPEIVALAVRSARAGECQLSPQVATRLVERLRATQPEAGAPEPAPSSLTARELEILRLLAEGKENSEIAAALTISPSTAKNHVGHVLDKLGLENRVQAAVYAVRAGIV